MDKDLLARVVMLAGAGLAGLVAMAHADDLDFRGRYVPSVFTPAAFDLYGGTGQGDSWIDLLGARNDGAGSLMVVSSREMGLAAPSPAPGPVATRGWLISPATDCPTSLPTPILVTKPTGPSPCCS